jgi:hypothetical protein
LRAEVFVFEVDYGAVGNAEAVVDVGLESFFALLFVESWAAGAWVDGFVIDIFVGRVHHGGEIFATAVARVNLSGDEELIEGFSVEREALGLIEDWRLPRDVEPCEVFEDGFGKL